ncbi:MAG: hypothetical protein HY695_07775 [Deltaproteobacteria bacterium]|nr:hypothetical protein [Deltaproteobacteria bacterium]
MNPGQKIVAAQAAAVALVFGWICLCISPASAGERLAYSIAQEEEVLRARRFTRTEIYAIEPGKTESHLLFTDAEADFILLPIRPSGERDQVMVVSGQRIFARGVEKNRYSGGWYELPAAIYELSTDGLNRYRKIFELRGEQRLSRLFVNPSGEKIGYLNQIGSVPYLFIHETADGKLIHQANLGRTFLDCFARNIGWTADGSKLFFTLETGDEHVTSRQSYKRVGSYFMNEDGSDVKRIPTAVLSPAQKRGFRSDPDLPPVIVGTTLSGRYLMRAYQWRMPAERTASTLLYAVDPGKKSRRDYPVSATQGLYWFRVADSGRFIAYTEQASSAAPEQVWVLDLDSGKQTRLFTVSTGMLKPPYLGLIGWISE